MPGLGRVAVDRRDHPLNDQCQPGPVAPAQPVECTRRGGAAIITRAACLASFRVARAERKKFQKGQVDSGITSLVECRDCPVGKQLYEEQKEMKKKSKDQEAGSKGQAGMVACPDCGKLCKPAGLKRHQASCPKGGYSRDKRLKAEAKNPRPPRANESADETETRALRARVVNVAVKSDAVIRDLVAAWPALGTIILDALGDMRLDAPVLPQEVCAAISGYVERNL